MKKSGEVIFVGRVISVVTIGLGSAEATLRIEKSWKGATDAEIKVRTSGGCRVGFEVDYSYLVYATKDADGNLSTDVCLGSGVERLRKEDIKRLGKPLAVFPKVGLTTQPLLERPSITLGSSPYANCYLASARLLNSDF